MTTKQKVIPVPAQQTNNDNDGEVEDDNNSENADEPEQGNNADDGGNDRINALGKVQRNAEDHVHIDAPVPENGNDENNIKPNQANEIDPNEVTTDAKTNDANDNTDGGEDNDEPNLQQQLESDDDKDEHNTISARDDNVEEPTCEKISTVSKPVVQYEPSMTGKDYNANGFIAQVLHHATYDTEFALMMAKVIMEICDRMTNATTEASFSETYSLKTGIRVLGKRGEKAAFDEVNQLHLCGCFNLVDVTSLTKEERDRVLESLIFLTKKRGWFGKSKDLCQWEQAMPMD